jgi:hypothetical protein
LNHAGLDSKALREAQVALDRLAFRGGQPRILAFGVHANRHAAGMQVVGDTTRPAQ